MAQTTLNVPAELNELRYTRGFKDDFDWYVTAHRWTTVVSDSGTVAVGDAVPDIAVLTPSDGSVGDNDEAYLKTTNEVFKFVAGKGFMGEMLLQFTEANTDDANVAMMFQNAIGANSILDDGAGLKVTGDTIGIYKVDGGTVWKCVSVINGGTALVTTSTTTAGGSAYQALRIKVECNGTSGATAEITYWCDNGSGMVQLMETMSNGILRPIKHIWTIASATEMQFGAGVKNGFTNLETLNIDYAAAYATRR